MSDIDYKSDAEKLSVSEVWQERSNTSSEVSIFCAHISANTIWFDCKKGGGRKELSVLDFLTKFEPKKETIDEFCDRKNQELKDDMSTIYDQPEPKSQEVECDTPRSVQILNEAVQIMAERGKSYDKSGGEAERSMPKIVAMFNALTGHELTPEQGWKFMCCLKLARSEQGEYREDNYLDGAAYMALAGEEAEAGSE